MWYVIAGELTLILSLYVKALPISVFIMFHFIMFICGFFCLLTTSNDRRNKPYINEKTEWKNIEIKRKSFWRTIDTAPKDGTLVIVGKSAVCSDDHVILYPIQAKFIDGLWQHDFAENEWSPFQPQPTIWKPMDR